jgi:hypothetical protein
MGPAWSVNHLGPTQSVYFKQCTLMSCAAKLVFEPVAHVSETQQSGTARHSASRYVMRENHHRKYKRSVQLTISGNLTQSDTI